MGGSHSHSNVTIKTSERHFFTGCHGKCCFLLETNSRQAIKLQLFFEIKHILDAKGRFLVSSDELSVIAGTS